MKIHAANGTVTFSSGNDTFRVILHRTLRLPEDSKTHALPPSLGGFPIKLIDDYKEKVPPAWRKHGGIFFPMWQREAMWLGFTSGGRPAAVKVAAGKINAVSGKKWKNKLKAKKGQPDYMVAPPQPWLDGFNTGDGVIKQFVAMPLGQGYTVEGQITGKESFGGIQLLVAFPKAGLLGRRARASRGAGGQSVSFGGGGSFGGLSMNSSLGAVYGSSGGQSTSVYTCSVSLGDEVEVKTKGGILRGQEMGLAAGGSMKQKIYPDPHGIDTWNQDDVGRSYIHIVNAQMYEQITGEKPPASPISAQTYATHGLPWYDVYDEHMGDIAASEKLSGVKTVSQKDAQHGFIGQQDDSTISGTVTVTGDLQVTGSEVVRDGQW